MSLAALAAANVRCIIKAELELHPEHNLVWGANGSGKTSLLEAIYLLGRGRSFRTRNSQRLIRYGESQLTVHGRTGTTPEQTLAVQVSRSSATVGKLAGVYVQSLAELSWAFPVQVVDPGIHKLVEDGGHRRRRWMDWGVFHVEQGFVQLWTSYARALKQRNAALRAAPDSATLWDVELVRWGEPLAQARGRWVERLQPYWGEMSRTLVGLEVSLTYSRGWPENMSFAEALAASRGRDAMHRTTHVGPHRADATLRIGTHLAREALSRGQQKLVGLALVLGQLRVLQQDGAITPTLLLDDPAAELDQERLGVFIHEVKRLNCQLVITALEPESDAFGRPNRVFHVEQGRVQPV
jgi:DNA replication and repair protein RecF